MIPYILIFIFSIVGLILWGLKGLLGGLFIGYLFSLLIGFLVRIFDSKFDVSLIKKKYRKAIAKKFVDDNLQQILSIPKYSITGKNEIIEQFSKYINEIFDSAIRIDNPVRKHNQDLNYASYKENFIRGGKEIWLHKFSEQKEHQLMKKYLDFCVNEIYVEFYKYN